MWHTIYLLYVLCTCTYLFGYGYSDEFGSCFDEPGHEHCTLCEARGIVQREYMHVYRWRCVGGLNMLSGTMYSKSCMAIK